jgi:hypothetical protein
LKSVFLLLHSYERDDCEETKTIGIYSTNEKAQNVIEKYKKLSGFKDYPDCFYIAEYEIDKDHWEEGFITLYPVEC